MSDSLSVKFNIYNKVNTICNQYSHRFLNKIGTVMYLDGLEHIEALKRDFLGIDKSKRNIL